MSSVLFSSSKRSTAASLAELPTSSVSLSPERHPPVLGRGRQRNLPPPLFIHMQKASVSGRPLQRHQENTPEPRATLTFLATSSRMSASCKASDRPSALERARRLQVRDMCPHSVRPVLCAPPRALPLYLDAVDAGHWLLLASGVQRNGSTCVW